MRAITGEPMYRIKIVDYDFCECFLYLKTDDLVSAIRLAVLNSNIVSIDVISEDPVINGRSIWPVNESNIEYFTELMKENIGDLEEFPYMKR